LPPRKESSSLWGLALKKTIGSPVLEKALVGALGRELDPGGLVVAPERERFVLAKITADTRLNHLRLCKHPLYIFRQQPEYRVAGLRQADEVAGVNMSKCTGILFSCVSGGYLLIAARIRASDCIIAGSSIWSDRKSCQSANPPLEI
jgi:hypothetical protein